MIYRILQKLRTTHQNKSRRLKMAEVTCHVSIAHFFFVFMTFLFVFGFPDSSSAEVVQNVCRSAECINIAKRITQSMDTSISPCDDFHKFVCNKFDEIEDKVPERPMYQMITSLLAGSSSSQQNGPYKKAFKLYELCMAENVTNAYVLGVMNQVIQRIGGWPIVEGDKWHQKKLEDIVTSLSQSGYYSGIFFEPILEIVPQRSVIGILPMNFDEIEDIDDAAWIATQLRANSSNIAEIRETIQNVSDHFVNFKSDYAVNFTELTLGEMMVRWPSIEWMKYFTSYFANSTNVIIDTNTNVSLAINHVDDVVNFIARTSNEQIMNYVISRVVEELGWYLPSVAAHFFFGIRSRTNFTTSEYQKYCTAVDMLSLPEMMISILRENYIDQNMLNKFSNFGESIRDKMGELINQAHLDNETLQMHQETLSNITFGIWYFNEKVEESVDLYKDLTLNEQDFGDTLWNVVKFHHNSHVERIWKLGTPRQPLPADITISTNQFQSLDAEYDPRDNIISVTLASVTPEYFQNGFPKYLRYGMLGNLIAHEISHSVSLDEIWTFEGNSTSFSQAQKNVLSSKLDCFKRKYKAYNTEELNATVLNARSLIEDVTDHIGCKVAHSVYKDWLNANGPEPQLPNLNYTSMQMFWISYAQNWCDDVPELEVVREMTEDYSSNRFRVNMPLSNNLAFSEAFKCQPGSRMNPIEKCSFW